MQIKVNGVLHKLEKEQTISEFIKSLGKEPSRFLVEYNGKALRYTDFKDLSLKDGDILEIMLFVAGG